MRGIAARRVVECLVCISRQPAIRRWQSGSAKEEDENSEDRLADVRFMKRRRRRRDSDASHQYGKGRVAGSFEAAGFRHGAARMVLVRSL